jgi:hypothetical protein
MAEKETVGVRLPTDKVNEIEQIAEENDITKSDATRRLIRKGLNLEEMGLSVTGVRNSSDDHNQETTYTNHSHIGQLIGPLIQSFFTALFTVMFLVEFGVI